MSCIRFPTLRLAGSCIVACLLPAATVNGATIVAEPGEAGLRAAIEAAQPGDTLVLHETVRLQASVVLNKPLTIRIDPPAGRIVRITGSFDGALLQIRTDGIVLDRVRIYGSPQTDGLRLDSDVVLRECVISSCRNPLVVEEDFWDSTTTVRLESVTVTGNHAGLSCPNLWAKDSVFSFNGGFDWGAGASVWSANLDGCRFEYNEGSGLNLIYGDVENCVMRFNGGYGLFFDPDSGEGLNLSGSLFYANAGGGAYLGEEGEATVDNCTFTRHTALPAITVSDSHHILFRHCTVADNVVITGDPIRRFHPPGAAFWIDRANRVELQNCLVADNPGSDSPHASGLVGEWVDGGGNMIGGPAGLDYLRDNGGPTLSLLPLPGSPAIDVGIASDLLVDASGLARLAGAAPDAGAIEIDATALLDEDNDGLPDLWERYHQLDPNDPSDAFSDRDFDGSNALAEFNTRTDPADPQSVHRIQVTLVPRAGIQPRPRYINVRWSRYPGLTYELETSNDLVAWQKVPGAADSRGRENGRTIAEQSVQVGAAAGFFRVRVIGGTFAPDR